MSKIDPIQDHQVDRATKRTSKISINQSQQEAKITSIVGKGDEGRTNLVFITIVCSFLIGAIFSILIVIKYWNVSGNEKIDLTAEIKNVWEIVIPLITLSLGYAFGKHDINIKG